MIRKAVRGVSIGFMQARRYVSSCLHGQRQATARTRPACLRPDQLESQDMCLRFEKRPTLWNFIPGPVITTNLF